MGKTTFYQTSNEHYNLGIKSSNGLVCVLSFEHPILGFKGMNIEHHAYRPDTNIIFLTLNRLEINF